MIFYKDLVHLKDEINRDVIYNIKQLVSFMKKVKSKIL